MKIRMSSWTHRTGIIILAWYFLSFAVVLMPGTAVAHSPSNVTLSYDKATKTLSVTITHTVSDPQSHYIKKVTIMLNEMVMDTHPSQDWNEKPVTIVSEDRIIQTHTYNNQPTSDTFTYSYTVDAVPGTKLSAVADCSYFGSNTGTVTVP